MNSVKTLASEPVPQVRARRRSASSSLLFIGDCLVVALCMALAYYLRYILNIGVSELGDRPGPLAYLIHYSLGFGLFFLLAENQALYDSDVTPFAERAISRLLQIAVFWAVMFLGSSLILKTQPPISRLFVGYSCAFMCLLLPLWRLVYLNVARRGGFDKNLTKRVVIVGSGPENQSVAQKLTANQSDPYEIVGIINTHQGSDESGIEIPVIGSLDDLEGILSTHDIDVVAVADTGLSQKDTLKIAKMCERSFVEFNLVPSQFEVFAVCLGMKMIGTQPVLGIAELPQNRVFNRFAKRSLDMVGSIFGLLISIFPILILAIMIKREDPGPAFFVQKRIGKSGKSFKMIKLRSMKIGSEKSDHLSQSTGRDDDRILKCGKFMRKWNIDEMPQFLNVFKSDMSLVGPRPERMYHVSKLLDEIPYYQSRHSVRPGMTGWAQVNGLRGDTSLEERIRLDLHYIENWSLWLDIVIQFRTFFQYKNAY